MNELTDGGYEMLRAAVNAARQFHCQSVKILKDRLLLAFPGREVAPTSPQRRICQLNRKPQT
jgi:hypothetical protein